METYYITTYEEYSYETIYAVDANSIKEAIELFRARDTSVEEIDSNFIDTINSEIVSVQTEKEYEKV